MQKKRNAQSVLAFALCSIMKSQCFSNKQRWATGLEALAIVQIFSDIADI